MLGERKVQSTDSPAIEQQQSAANHSPTDRPTLSDADLVKIIRRVIESVSKAPNGIWSSRIEVEYTRAYNEQLPSNWLVINKDNSTEGSR